MSKQSISKFSIAERRRVLKVLSAGATLVIPGWALANNSIWVPEDLPITPQQTEGPFYPNPTIEQQLFNDTDLGRKLGDHEQAKGQLCKIDGVIKDRKGKPLKGAVVEVWQACASGRYHHELDNKNPALLDNNFQFWGRALTGDDGRYSFSTIVPGKYPGRTARHIHYRVDADGFRRCSTQCYFSDFGEDNMRDSLYTNLNRQERELVTIEFDKPAQQQPVLNPTEKSTEAAKLSEQGIENKQTASGKQNLSEQKNERSVWRGNFDIVLANG